MGLSGRFRSALVIGGQGIRARKLRTFLSMVSLFLGVLAIVTVQAGSVLANRALLADIELRMAKDGTTRVNLSSSGKTVPIAVDTLAGRSDVVGTLTATAIIGEPGVRPINPGPSPLKYANQDMYGNSSRMVCDSSGTCRVMEQDAAGILPRGQAVELQLVLLTGDIRPYRPFPVEAGRWLDFGGPPSLSPSLVLNREAATALTQYRLPAEMQIISEAKNPTPRIIGTVHDANEVPTAYVRADEAMAWMSSASLGNLSLELYLNGDGEPLLQTLLARMSAVSTDPVEPYRSVVNSREHIGGQLDLMRWIFLGMAALVLLIGVAGILNVGLATVGERVEEFALRRAVGTPRLLLAGIVLAETLITGLLTAAAAIGVGVAGLQVAGTLFGDRREMLHDVAFPWEAGVAGVVAGLVAGILGGLFPAIRAARIPIATVMRA